MMGCLYRLDFPSGKSYIGVTQKTVQSRLKQHVVDARRGDRPIGQAIREYGAASCRAVTLVVADDWAYLKDLERKAIAVFGTFRPGGYNSTLGGDGVLDPTGESEQKRRAKLRATKRRPEIIAKLSAVHKASWNDPDRRAARAAEMRAMWGDPEYRERQRASHRGKTPSPETAAKRLAGCRRWWDANRKHPKKTRTPEQIAALATVRSLGLSRTEMITALFDDPAYRDVMLRRRVATQKTAEYRQKASAAAKVRMSDSAVRLAIAVKLFPYGDRPLVKSSRNPYRCDSAAFRLWDHVPPTATFPDLVGLGFTSRQVASAIRRGALVPA